MSVADMTKCMTAQIALNTFSSIYKYKKTPAQKHFKLDSTTSDLHYEVEIIMLGFHMHKISDPLQIQRMSV